MREKDAVYTILFFFSCYTRKGMLCASAKFGAITKSKIPMHSIALRVRLRGYTAPLRMTRVLIAILIRSKRRIPLHLKRNSTVIIHYSSFIYFLIILIMTNQPSTPWAA